MLTIRQIMTPQVFTLDADTDADEAAWGLTWRKFNGAPVRDREGKLIGVLSKSDLVNPEPDTWIRGPATVGDLMNPDVVAVYDSDPAITAAIVMTERKIHQVLVLDAEGKVAGIVGALDVIKAVAGGASFDPNS